jgi:hypothetical protein
MAKKKQKISTEVILVNVLYEDGTQRSNRKVPAAELSGFDDEKDIRTVIEDQDNKIAQLSGQRPAPIKSIVKVGRR